MRVTIVAFLAGALSELLGRVKRGYAVSDGVEDVKYLLDLVGNELRAAAGT